MILLASTSDLLRITTSGTANIDVHASFVDMAGAAFTPGRTNTAISSATTTTVVASPAASTYRTVKTLTIRNRHATTANAVTVIHTDGTTVIELIKITLAAGEVLHYHESAGFWVTDAFGRTLTNNSANGSSAAVNSLNLVVLAADVTNNNATANTIASITGLEFSVTAGEGYKFKFTIFYTAAATSTGSRWSIAGPTSPTQLAFSTRNTLAAAAGTDGETTTFNTAYDSPAASNASSAAAGNIAIIEGFIEPSANGTVTGRFASEITNSAIVAKKGSLLEWYRVY